MKQPTQFVLCLDNQDNEASLIRGKVYATLPDADAAKDDLVRVIDESGEEGRSPEAPRRQTRLRAWDRSGHHEIRQA